MPSQENTPGSPTYNFRRYPNSTGAASKYRRRLVREAKWMKEMEQLEERIAARKEEIKEREEMLAPLLADNSTARRYAQIAEEQQQLNEVRAELGELAHKLDLVNAKLSGNPGPVPRFDSAELDGI